MKILKLKSQKLLRTLFGCFGFTAIAFVFQACYGPGPGPYYDIRLSGEVKSKTTRQPIEGIKVAVFNESYEHYVYGITDKKGKFDFYASVPNRIFYGYDDSIYHPDSVKINFFDIDGIKNGEFEDHTVIINPEHKDEVKIFVELEDKLFLL